MVSSHPVIRCFAANLWSPVVLSFGNLRPTYDTKSSRHSIICSQLLVSSRPVIRCFVATLWSSVVLSSDALRPTYDLQSSCRQMLCGQLTISSRPVIWHFAAYAVDKRQSTIQEANQLSLMNSLKAVNPTTLYPYGASGPDIYDVRMHLYVIIWMQNTASSMERIFLLSCSIKCPSFYATRKFITLFTRGCLWPLLLVNKTLLRRIVPYGAETWTMT